MRAAETVKSRRRGFQAMRDIPLVAWFVLIVVVAVAHQWIPAPRWLLLHLLFLGAATHAILVWSQHFAAALLRRPPNDRDRRRLSIRLGAANVGAAAVSIGVPSALWPLTVAGAALVAAAAVWHGASLVRRMRGALSGRFSGIIKYYVVAAACLPLGALLGAWIAGPGNATGGLVLAHALINVLGWLGLTVAGTLVTLWPTMLRTRADAAAAPGAARALPPLAVAVVVSAAGAAAGSAVLMAIGLLGYIGGLSLIGVSLWRVARVDPPRSFASLSVGSALLWWIGCLLTLFVTAVRAAAEEMLGSSGGPESVELIRTALADTAPYLAAGFAAQLLIGALSYLVPAVIGGGPAAAKVGAAAFDRGSALRVSVANAALLVCALPVSSVTRVAASILYLVSVASFLPIMTVAMRAQLKTKRAEPLPFPGVHRGAPSGSVPDTARQHPDRAPAHRRAAQATAGILAVTLVVAIGAAFDPRSLAPVAALGSTSPQAEDTPVQTVAVEATAGMRFTPDRIEVPHGTHLFIELTNTDPVHPHDLVLDTGVAGGRLAPGESETIDVGIVTADAEGWCSLVGHRQQGMTLDIVVTGSGSDAPQSSDESSGEHASGHQSESGPGSGSSLSTADVDLSATPGDGFEPYDPALPPLEPADGPVTREITLTVSEITASVAPGIQQTRWTFGSSAPGPILHGRVGDTFEVTLVNDGTIGHSIDFHAGSLAPDEPMRTIAPGEELNYTFTATRAGIWMYHCSTPPMSTHIASGMFGAVIIEPKNLPPVDRSYVLVQSEHYLGEQGGEIDADKLVAETPDLLSFNGYAAQYDHAPLAARAGERVRVWALDAGPNRAMSFHVIGGQFDTVWFEGAYLLGDASGPAEEGGSQALGLQPAQGGFVELVFPEPGHYPFVSHLMVDAERGAHGIFEVTE